MLYYVHQHQTASANSEQLVYQTFFSENSCLLHETWLTRGAGANHNSKTADCKIQTMNLTMLKVLIAVGNWRVGWHFSGSVSRWLTCFTSSKDIWSIVNKNKCSFKNTFFSWRLSILITSWYTLQSMPSEWRLWLSE